MIGVKGSSYQEMVFPLFVKVGELRFYNPHVDEDHHMGEKIEQLLVNLVMLSLLKHKLLWVMLVL